MALAHKVQTLWRWPLPRRLLALQFTLAAGALEVSSHLTPTTVLLRSWPRWARSRPGRNLPLFRRRVTFADRVVIVTAASELFRPGRSCLPRALLLWWDLLADGVDAELVIGTRTRPAFAAHAWVEIGGEAIAERRPPAHQPLACWDAAGRVRAGRHC
jgi:hypothetical protein